MIQRFSLALAVLIFYGLTAHAEDWPQFRGPTGSGVATGSAVPTAWSPSANVGWKTELPGPGASSPIIIDGKAFVTCYSGYGLTKEDPGDLENLVRHLVCVDMKSGEKLWQKDVKVVLPEDPYTGIGVTAHGYASHTPVSDGKNVYAFFGKSGVHAYDMDGNKIWQADVGKESDPTKWGSSSSPLVYKNMVIITASAESQAIIGLDKESGKEIWRQEAKGLDGMWGTPTLIKVDEDRTDLVLLVAKELWGLDPTNGKLKWYANATGAGQAYSSLVLDGKRVYAVTGRGGGSIALDVGGTGDISESNTVWTGRDVGSFSSPVKHNSKLFSIARNIVTVVDAETGKSVEKLRLKGAKSSGSRFGSLDYASPVVAGDHLYYLNGSGQMYVFEVGGDKMKQVAVNEVTSDKEIFWGTPAISDGQMIIRSSNHLYCVTDKGEEVKQDPAMLAKADEPAGGGGVAGAGDGGRAGGGRPGGGRAGGGRPGGGGSRQFDPSAMFDGMDADKDGKVTAKEMEGNRMATRLMTLDKDGDKAISKEEFTTGIGSLFSGGGNRGGGGGGYGGRGKDTRPDRPQRPESDG
ncbi:MAG: PQQ-binding-like beta-propeller repeat protein [Mariniblastus sp.]